jgi:phosphatidylinositol alpha-mannosyltransferase
MFPGDYQIIANGIDLKRFGKSIATTDRSERDNNLTILFVGRLDKRKGFPHLFEAFLKLKPDYPQLKLQIIGPFEARACRSYEEMSRAQGVTDIEFVGYVSPERLPAFYHQADIFCAPSIGFESFGIVLLEAMAAGLPVVASDITGYRSVIRDGQEGLLVPPGQSGQLAQALRQVINQPDLRQKLGKSGRLRANQFSWDVIVNKTLEVYINTIQNKFATQSKFIHQVRPDNGLVDVHFQRRQASHVE